VFSFQFSVWRSRAAGNASLPLAGLEAEN